MTSPAPDAVAYSCSILVERRRVTFYLPSLAQARGFCPILERAAGNGRKALVHAIDEDGGATLIENNAPDPQKADLAPRGP